MGRGSYWGEVIDVLRDIIPVYDKVNSAISFGKDVETEIEELMVEFYLETISLTQVQVLGIWQRLHQNYVM